ncbi:MAG: hypothetical protein MUC42_16300 [Bryobacter sp.]|jgi:hypothetical protein|nr:hypothetical protein [Bryobacter sp.]
MRILILVSLALAPLAALAQSSHGYVFAAPGGITAHSYTTSGLQFGGGGTGIIKHGIGFNVELSSIGPTRALGESIGAFAVGGVYHFRRGDVKVDPFAGAGYTLLFRSGTGQAWNIGGGLNYWFSRHVGLRTEFRDHIWARDSGVHYWGFRFGVSFR